MTEKDKQILRQMRADIDRLIKKDRDSRGNARNDGYAITAGRGSGSHGRRSHPIAPRLLWVKITANETGGGKYQGKSYTHDVTTDIAATGNLAESELGTLAAEVDCRVLNFAEEGETTHDFTAGTPEIDTFLCHWFRTNSDGIKVCAVVAYDRETCA